MPRQRRRACPAKVDRPRDGPRTEPCGRARFQQVRGVARAAIKAQILPLCCVMFWLFNCGTFHPPPQLARCCSTVNIFAMASCDWGHHVRGRQRFVPSTPLTCPVLYASLSGVGRQSCFASYPRTSHIALQPVHPAQFGVGLPSQAAAPGTSLPSLSYMCTI